MVVCFYGKITQIDDKVLRVWNEGTSEFIEVNWDGKSSPEVNDRAVFVGEYKSGKFFVHDINIRKFLNPLDETELYKNASDSGEHVLNSLFYEIAAEMKNE